MQTPDAASKSLSDALRAIKCVPWPDSDVHRVGTGLENLAMTASTWLAYLCVMQVRRCLASSERLWPGLLKASAQD